MKHNGKSLSRKINIFANDLLEYLHRSYPNSKYETKRERSVYRSLELCPNIYMKFRKWNNDKKPYFLILYRGTRYIMEFDLSRVIFDGTSKIKWILNRPTRQENVQNLIDLEYSYEEQTENDIVAIHSQMISINGTANRTNKGYRFCINEDIAVVHDKFKDLIEYTIRTDQAKDVRGGNTEDDDDIEAVEGQIREGRYLSKKRNRALVAKRKEIDDYTCQACSFYLRIKGKYVIECHHLFPLKGEIITRLDDLSCLCPTCHRIAHKRKTPFTIEEIKKALLKIK
jgi:hypothetical protein